MGVVPCCLSEWFFLGGGVRCSGEALHRLNGFILPHHDWLQDRCSILRARVRTSLALLISNGFELSGQGYDHSVSIRSASLVCCSELLAGAQS